MKLLKLSPEAADIVSRTEADEGSPSLDMSIIREVARKLPEELQAPVLDVLHGLAAKRTTDELKKLIGQLADFCAVDNWVASSDFEQPTHPRVFNRLRLLGRLVAGLPPKTLVERAMKLHAWESYNNKLNKPAKITGNDWLLGRIGRTLAGQQEEHSFNDLWISLAPEMGLTCESCIKQPLGGTIDDHPSWESPCLLLQEKDVATCEQYVAADEPPVITLPNSLVNDIPEDAPERKLIKNTLIGGGEYVATWTDYVHLYSQARHYCQARKEEREEKAATAYLEPMRQYWQAQVNEELDLFDFQAHSCQKCKFFELANKDKYGIPCKFANGQLQSKDRPVSPTYGVLVDAEGRAVPRCSKFRYAEMPQIVDYPEGVKLAGDDAKELILRWYEWLVSVADNSYKTKMIFGPLAWLPDGKPTRKKILTDLWPAIGDAQMLTLLTIGVVEAQVLVNRSYSSAHLLPLVTPSGQETLWQAMEWADYISQREPWNWKGPLPWNVRGADTNK